MNTNNILTITNEENNFNLYLVINFNKADNGDYIAISEKLKIKLNTKTNDLEEARERFGSFVVSLINKMIDNKTLLSFFQAKGIVRARSEQEIKAIIEKQMKSNNPKQENEPDYSTSKLINDMMHLNQNDLSWRDSAN